MLIAISMMLCRGPTGEWCLAQSASVAASSSSKATFGIPEVLDPLTPLLPAIPYAFQIDLVNPMAANASQNVWQFMTTHDGEPVHNQFLEGYMLDGNNTESMSDTSTVEDFDAAAVVPRTVDALVQTDVCIAFKTRSSCSSLYGCELHIRSPMGFTPEDAFCGSSFQRGRLSEIQRCLPKAFGIACLSRGQVTRRITRTCYGS